MARAPRTWHLVSVLVASSIVAGAVAGVIAGRTGRPDTVVTSATLPSRSATSTRAPPSVPDVVAGIAASVVAIHASVPPPEDDQQGSLLVDATGTGFVIASDGLIATAAHVIRDAWSISVDLSTGETLPASVVGVDDATDLAVLAVEKVDLVPVVFGRTSEVRVGEPVIALGHALGLGSTPTVSTGVLSAVERTIAGSDGGTYDHLLQTDAAINTGHSGGPLLNARGEVIGINTSRLTLDDAEGVGFAICTDHALPVLDALQR